MSSSSLVHCSTTTRSTILTYCYLLHLLHLLHVLHVALAPQDTHCRAHPNQVSDDEKPYA